MGILVRLIGNSLGLASEAIHQARSRPSPSSGSSSQPIGGSPPEYVEVADEATAEALIRSGQAEYVADSADQQRSRGPLSAQGVAQAQSKAPGAGYADQNESASDSDDDDVGVDEAAWELDDMTEQVAPPAYEEVSDPDGLSPQDSEEGKQRKRDEMIRKLVAMAGPVPQPTKALSCPVIIPQRRPRSKDRGFVHAYAPVLAECGIGQDVFLKFLADWLQASKADPWIDVVWIAAGVASFVPEVAAQVVGTVLQVIAGTAREVQSRHRRNSFLDLANQQLFMPRGLFAMVMTFKDEVPGQQQPASGALGRLASMFGQPFVATKRLDINEAAQKYSNPDPEMSRTRKNLQNIRLTSGKTYGQIELPEAAELVFPEFDRAVDRQLAQDGGETPEKEGFRNKMKGAGEFVQDYLDRRAQAEYAAKHQGSALSVPDSSRPAFASRFSDPNHPVNSGSLISLLTGGALNPAPKLDQWREARRTAKNERKASRREFFDNLRTARGKAPKGPRRMRDPKRERVGARITKVLQQDVLYLIIVNLPSESEVQDSVAALEHLIAEAGGARAE